MCFFNVLEFIYLEYRMENNITENFRNIENLSDSSPLFQTTPKASPQLRLFQQSPPRAQLPSQQLQSFQAPQSFQPSQPQLPPQSFQPPQPQSFQAQQPQSFQAQQPQLPPQSFQPPQPQLQQQLPPQPQSFQPPQPQLAPQSFQPPQRQLNPTVQSSNGLPQQLSQSQLQSLEQYIQHQKQLSQQMQQKPQIAKNKIAVVDGIKNKNQIDNDQDLVDKICIGNMRIPKQTLYLIIVLILIGITIWYLNRKSQKKQKKHYETDEDE